MEREPITEAWPPAPAPTVFEKAVAKPRLLTGREWWDKAVGFVSAVILLRLVLEAGTRWIGFLSGQFGFLLSFRGSQTSLVLAAPLLLGLLLSFGIYFLLRIIAPVVTKSFGISMLGFTSIGFAFVVFVHFFPKSRIIGYEMSSVRHGQLRTRQPLQPLRLPTRG